MYQSAKKFPSYKVHLKPQYPLIILSSVYSNDTWNARLEALNTSDNGLWEAQRFLKNKRSQIPTLNCAIDMAVTEPQKANLLANTIKNNFIEYNCMQDNYKQDDKVVTSAVNNFLSSSPSTQIEPAMPDEIINFIKNTSSKKASGKDTITNKMLKNFPIELILILTILFNKILKFHHFPSNGKEAIIFPIIKPGKNKNLPNSYRPISLLSTLSKKLTEYIILNRLKKIINDKSLINPNQYGLTNKLSTLHPFLRLTESISEGFHKKKSTGVVFLDIQKAFDRVWILGFTFKLITYEIPSPLIHSYLTNISFRIRVNESHYLTLIPCLQGVLRAHCSGPCCSISILMTFPAIY
ncbi:probable RNA-directed DNA polymerase from transposon BS [Trichonephila clavipes]|nr:probable RNA-directed DNA polymerase from transposon BS [Trichonephila clavipes]